MVAESRSVSFPQSAQADRSASAPTIVFLHGGGAGGWMWQPVVDQLQKVYHCLTPDLPEHGENRAIGPFSMALAAEKTAELIRTRAHGGKATVVGLSEGAQVTVQLLASTPELVEKAIVSSALLLPIPGYGWLNTPGMLAWAYRMSVPPFRNSDWWIRINMKYSAGIPEQFFTPFKKEFQQMTERGFVNLMLANQRFRLPQGLEQAIAPTLVIAGSKEYAVMKESARRLGAALPNANVMQINLGKNGSIAKEHNWAMTAPDLFAQTVRAWIEGTPLPEELAAL